jgi:hypothetical protein
MEKTKMYDIGYLELPVIVSKVEERQKKYYPTLRIEQCKIDELNNMMIGSKCRLVIEGQIISINSRKTDVGKDRIDINIEVYKIGVISTEKPENEKFSYEDAINKAIKVMASKK